MKISLAKVTLLVVTLPLLVHGTPAQAAMTGAQIKAALSGKSFSYTGPATGTLKYNANGKLSVTYHNNGRSGSKTGTWFTRGNKLCSKMVRRGSKGKKTVHCNAMTDLGGGKYKTDNGYTITPR